MAGRGVCDELRPHGLGFADHHRVAVEQRLVGERSHVEPADDGGDPCGAVPLRQSVRVLDLSRERRKRGEVTGREFVDRSDILNLVVVDLVLVGSESSNGQQSQTRQCGNDPAALDKSGQGQSQRGEFRIVGPHAAHGNQGDAHGASFRRPPSWWHRQCPPTPRLSDQRQDGRGYTDHISRPRVPSAPRPRGSEGGESVIRVT